MLHIARFVNLRFAERNRVSLQPNNGQVLLLESTSTLAASLAALTVRLTNLTRDKAVKERSLMASRILAREGGPEYRRGEFTNPK